MSILSDNNADDGGGGGGSANPGKTVTLTPDEESRREAEALAVLLSSDRSPVAGAVAAARRNERRNSVVGAKAAGNRVACEESGTEAAAAAAAAAAMVVKESVQAKGKGPAAAGQKAAESALTRLAARYLVRETVRGKIPDPVANFHVRRVEWCACAGPVVLASCGTVGRSFGSYGSPPKLRITCGRARVVRMSDHVRKFSTPSQSCDMFLYVTLS